MSLTYGIRAQVWDEPEASEHTRVIGWSYLTKLHEVGIGFLIEDASRQLHWCYKGARTHDDGTTMGKLMSICVTLTLLCAPDRLRHIHNNTNEARSIL